MAFSMLQVALLLQVYCLFVSANTYKKIVVCNDYRVAFHNDETCFVSNCKFHNILLGSVEVLLRKLDTFCFTYQLLDCLYTLFGYRFSRNVSAMSGQTFNNVQRAVDFNHRNKGKDRMPSIAKKGSRTKSSKSIYSPPFRRQKQRILMVQCLQKKNKQVKKTKLELELIKILDCFLDGYGIYASNLVTVRMKFLWRKFPFHSTDNCINQW